MRERQSYYALASDKGHFDLHCTQTCEDYEVVDYNSAIPIGAHVIIFESNFADGVHATLLSACCFCCFYRVVGSFVRRVFADYAQRSLKAGYPGKEG